MPDKPIEDILNLMEKVVAQGGLAYIKWTCPKCGERVTSDQANCFYMQGYKHTEKDDGTPCGETYRGTMFGLRALFSTKEALEKWDELHQGS